MKGFIRILESIVASIIILTTLAFFFSASVKQTNWDDAFLQVRTEDIVASLSINGTIGRSIESNDQAILNDAILNPNVVMLPITVDYSLEVEGIPSPVIRIGCNCTDSQVQDLRGLVSPSVVYKGRTITFVVYQAQIGSVHSDASTSVLFLEGYRNLTPFRDELEIFLRRGGTIFMRGDISQSQVNDGYVNETFGLRWAAGARSDAGEFFDPGNENITSFRISKYYGNITPETASFDFSGLATIAADNGTVIRGATGLSLAKANSGIIDGSGRTVWMSGSGDAASAANITKSLLMWASGERFSLNPVPLPQSKYFRTAYIINGKDPYKVSLTLWRIFQ